MFLTIVIAITTAAMLLVVVMWFLYYKHNPSPGPDEDSSTTMANQDGEDNNIVRPNQYRDKDDTCSSTTANQHSNENYNPALTDENNGTVTVTPNVNESESNVTLNLDGNEANDIAIAAPGSNVDSSCPAATDIHANDNKTLAIEYDKDTELGENVRSTVYHGKFNGNTVAVKRSLIKCSTDELASLKEYFASLIKSTIKEEGQHVLKYRTCETLTDMDGNWFMAAMDLCQGNLEDYIADQTIGKSDALTSKQVMIQIATGINYLHKNKMIHGNLKPTNVLFQQDCNGSYIVKLADFGMSSSEQFIVDLRARSSGWLAPEVNKKLTEFTKTSKHPFTVACMDEKSDMFTLGLIYYYIETGGYLSFTNQNHIQKNKRSFAHLSLSRRIMRQLLQQMNSSEPSQRPIAAEIVEHPALWRTRKVLKFFSIVAELLEKGEISSEGLEKRSIDIIGGSWKNGLTQELYDALYFDRFQNGQTNYRFKQFWSGKRNKKANTGSIKSLLLAIRYTSAHYHDLSDRTRLEFGGHPRAFTEYWLSSFPLLLDHVHQAMKIYSNHSQLQYFYQ